jgi:hypothetical protein
VALRLLPASPSWCVSMLPRPCISSAAMGADGVCMMHNFPEMPPRHFAAVLHISSV